MLLNTLTIFKIFNKFMDSLISFFCSFYSSFHSISLPHLHQLLSDLYFLTHFSFVIDKVYRSLYFSHSLFVDAQGSIFSKFSEFYPIFFSLNHLRSALVGILEALGIDFFSDSSFRIFLFHFFIFFCFDGVDHRHGYIGEYNY